jgi:hypothetical protein
MMLVMEIGKAEEGTKEKAGSKNVASIRRQSLISRCSDRILDLDWKFPIFDAFHLYVPFEIRTDLRSDLTV